MDALSKSARAKYFSCCLMLLIVAGCASRPPLEAASHPDATLTTKIGHIMQRVEGSESKAGSPGMEFSTEEIRVLRQYKILGPALPNVLFFDRIHDASRQQVERTFLNWTGEVSRTTIVTLPEKEFWHPISLLAEYKRLFGSVPFDPEINPEMLNASLAQMRDKRVVKAKQRN